MRLVVAGAIILALLSGAPPAFAASRTQIGAGFGAKHGDASIRAVDSEDGNDIIQRRRGSGGTGPDNSLPTLTTCGVTDDSQFKSAALPACDSLPNGQLAFAVLVQPGLNPPNAPTQQQVLAFVRDYSRTLSMPVPQPQISAPEGITGARHSLDLRTQSARMFPLEDTAFGQLRATAHGTFTVNWGDGKTNTYHSAGAPWPNSNISHSWENRGTYDIGVTDNWSLDWSLGGYSGVITGLQTTGSITGWHVIEMQAVIIH